MPLIASSEPVGNMNMGYRPDLAVSDKASVPVEPAPHVSDTSPAIMQTAQTLEGVNADTSIPVHRQVYGGGPEVTSSAPPAEKPSILGAAFRQENLVASAIASGFESEHGAYDPDHDPFAIINKTKYEPYWQQFAGSPNEAATRARMQRIDVQLADRSALEKSGAAGTFAMLAASFLDPTILLPVLGLEYKGARGLQVLNSSLRVGGSFAGATAAQEAGLHATQEVRTLGESVAGIGGSFILGSFLGAAARGLTLKKFGALADRLEKDLHTPEDSAKDPLGTGGLKDGERRYNAMESEVETQFGGKSSAGAMQVADAMPPVKLESALGFEKWLSFNDPVLRTLNSPLQSARDAVTRLTEIVLGLDRNVRGFSTSPSGGSAETRIKTQGNGPLGDFLRQKNELFAEYRFGNPQEKMAAAKASMARFTGSSPLMTYKEFNAEVGKAAARSDKHDIPQVQKAAELWRKLSDKHGQEAVNRGLLDEEVFNAGKPAQNRKPPSRNFEPAERPAWNTPEGVRYLNIERMTENVSEALGLPIDDRAAIRNAIDTLNRVNPEFLAAVEKAATEYAMHGPTPEGLANLSQAFNAAMSHPSGNVATHAADTFAPHIGSQVWDDAGQSYLTRIWRRDKIKAEYQRFKDDIVIPHLEAAQKRAEAIIQRADQQEAAPDLDNLRQFADLPRGELDMAAQQIISHILGHPDGRMLFDLPAGVRGPLKARTFRIADDLVEEFLERDIDVISRFYTRSMVPQIEIHRAMGDLTLEGAFAKVGDEADAQIAKGADSVKTMAAKERAQRDLTAITERMQGLYAMPDDPTALTPRVLRGARMMTDFAKMGGVWLSSLSDVFRPMMVHGITSYFSDGLAPFLKNLEAVKLSARETQLAGAVDHILNSRQAAITDTLDDYGRYSKFERGLAWAHQGFHKMNLLGQWTQMGKELTGMMTQANIIRGVIDEAEGKAGADVIRKLRQSSIDEQDAMLIAQQFKKHGEVVDGVYLPNSTAWDANPRAQRALESFRGAIIRDVDRTIVTPGQDKALWISTEWGKVIGQYQSFGMASVQRTVLAGLQERDAGVLMGLLGMISMGAIGETVRNAALGRDQPKNTSDMLVNAIDRSGATAYLFQVNHFAELATGGAVGVSALTGREVSRYASRGVLDAVLGPTGGMAKDIFAGLSGATRAVAGKDQMKESDIRAIRRVLPLQNLFYLSWLFTQMEQGAVRQFNAIPAPVKH